MPPSGAPTATRETRGNPRSLSLPACGWRRAPGAPCRRARSLAGTVARGKMSRQTLRDETAGIRRAGLPQAGHPLHRAGLAVRGNPPVEYVHGETHADRRLQDRRARQAVCPRPRHLGLTPRRRLPAAPGAGQRGARRAPRVARAPRNPAWSRSGRVPATPGAKVSVKRLLLDVNVVLDVLLERRPHLEPAVALWAAIERRHALGLLAAHAVTTVYYLIEHEHDRRRARRALERLLSVYKVAPVDDAVIREGIRLDWPDFEDAVTAAAAAAAACDALEPQPERLQRLACTRHRRRRRGRMDRRRGDGSTPAPPRSARARRPRAPCLAPGVQRDPWQPQEPITMASTSRSLRARDGPGSKFETRRPA